VVEGDLLAGSHVLHPPYRRSCPDGPLKSGLSNQGDVYLELPRNRGYRSMSPLVRVAVCPECRSQRVLIADGGTRYIDVLIGHRVHLDA
jgi:hypothetical protein